MEIIVAYEKEDIFFNIALRVETATIQLHEDPEVNISTPLSSVLDTVLPPWES